MDSTFSVKLRHTQDRPFIRLREVTGNDEIGISDTTTYTAIQFINGLLLDSSTWTANKMVSSDRDAVLAAVYINLYGSRIEGISNCKQCSEPFDLNFHLPDLQQHIDTNIQSKEQGGFHYVDQYSFRLPTGEDELAVAELPADRAADELWKRCIVNGRPEQRQLVEEAMGKIAPMIQSDIETTCPGCGAIQHIRFDIQSYLLSKLKEEQKSLSHEVHRLASTYHWSYREIMSLPRKRRKTYVRLIEGEMS